MARELNPELFGEVKKETTQNNNPAWPPASALKPKPSAETQWAEALHQIDLLKRKLQDYESKLEMTNTRLTELVQATRSRLERMGTHTQRLESMARDSLKDIQEKYAGLALKVNERRVSDVKVQELVDRHQQMVHNFEMRMQQLQKVTSEQELQLMNAKSAMQEAQREIARSTKGRF